MEARESRKEGKDKVYLLLNIEAGGSEVEIFRIPLVGFFVGSR